jgi:hypothetical protein
MSNRVECKFCSKEKDGTCTAKKGTGIKLTKHRTCSKYMADEIKIKNEEVRKSTNPPIPTYKYTWRYYDKLLGGDGGGEDGPDLIRVN